MDEVTYEGVGVEKVKWYVGNVYTFYRQMSCYAGPQM